MDIIFNPIVLAVAVLIILCLLKVNVILSLLLSAMVAGITSGLSAQDTMSTLIEGMGNNAETALSYILLGILAAGMAHTKITELLSFKISHLIGNHKYILFAILALIACSSQNILPVHIAFIPILIPALLPLMNRNNIDRRTVACALAFGLEAPYITIPFGFGAIFQGIIAQNLTDNGMAIETSEIWKYTWPLGVSMIIGLIIAIYVFRKPREYKNIHEFSIADTMSDTKMSYEHYVALAAAIVTLIVNLLTSSLPLGALCGILVMLIFRGIPMKMSDFIISEGFKLMAQIAFIMLIAAGYANVISSTSALKTFVKASVELVNGNKLLAAILMMCIGLIVTMGIGTSFGTVPVLAILYVPLCQQLGFSIGGTVLLIAAAAALGDAGSPASDTTLGPTSGLNMDGQHNHIWDTCVPTAICFNVPMALCAILVSPFI